MKNPRLRPLAVLGAIGIVTAMLVEAPLAQAAAVDVTVDGSKTFQTIEALGADINPRSWDDGNLRPALDLLIDDAGLKTFRVGMDMMDWESTNDDSDPLTFNWDYYEPIYSGRVSFDTDLAGSSFADTWAVIDYLHEKGVPDSRIALSFMGPGPSWMGGSRLAPDMEDEFVEGVLSAAYYGWSHGHTFGLFSPNNEMDISYNEGVTMSGDRYADVLDRLAGRMDQLGMDGVELLGPETCCAVSYAEPMKQYPRLMDRLAAFDFHNYGGGDNGAADAVAGTGKGFWISEYGSWDQTFAYLDQGASGLLMWEAYDSVYNHAILNGYGTAPGNDSLSFGITPLLAYDVGTRTYSPRDEFYYFGQLMKWIPIGAQRIGASSADEDLAIEAFADASTRRLTLVGHNSSDGARTLSIDLAHLTAPASLEYFQTSSESHMERVADVVVTAGTATVTVPGRTAFTLTGTPSTGNPDPPDPPDTPGVTPLSAPSDLRATVGGASVDLTWAASVGGVGAVSYVVHRSRVPGFTPDDTNEVGRSSTTTFRDVGLPPGAHYYAVTAIDAVGTSSPPSVQTSATVPQALVLPDAQAPTAVPTAPAAPTAPTPSAIASALERALSRVKVAGRLAVGRTVRVTRLPADVQVRPALTYRFQWYAASKPITRATKARLVLTRAIHGKKVSVKVKASYAGVTSTRTIKVGRIA